MTKKICIIFLGIFQVLNVYSQSLQIFDKTPIKENPVIKNETPAAGKLSRNDDMSINEYLGIPNISIPLCDMKLSDIDIPINISYQATGIKVNQDASSVGLGWDLNTLGSVVQIVRGDDDMNPYRHPYLYRFLPDYYSSNYADFEYLLEEGYNSGFPVETNGYPIESIKEKYGYRTVFRDYFPINGKLVMGTQLRYSTNYWDTEPDIFIINILGEKLHCVTSDFPKNITQGVKSQSVVVLNKTGYIVKKDVTNDSWIVTNPQGTRFYFDLKQSFISDSYSAVSMFSVTGGSGDSSKNISSNTWYLTKIETAKGTIVDFKYDISEEVEFITIGNGVIEYITSHYQRNYDPGYLPKYLLNIFLNKAPVTYSTTKSIIKEKQYVLSQINSGKCNIRFNYTDRGDIPKYKRLEKITLSFESEQPAKTINFFYDYKSNLGEGKRLFLNSLNINGELYSFKYNQTQLPSRNSFAQDYWGYYNGNLNNKSLVPNPVRFGHTVLESMKKYYSPLTNNMSANLEYTKAGILERITYPTKGSVEFEYELNTFSNFWVPNYTNTNNPKSSGSEGFGLRVKSVVHKDYDSKILKKKVYEYDGGRSVIFHKFDKYGSVEWINSPLPRFSISTGFCAMNTSSLSDVNPFSTHTGVGYDRVSCVFESVTDNKKYMTTTLFHNISHTSSAYQDITRNLLHTIHMPSFENSNYPKNGSVKEKRYYDDSGNLVRKEEFQYKNEKSNMFYGVKLMKIQDVYQQPPGHGDPYQPGISRYLLGYYPVFDFESLLTKKTEQTYKDSEAVEVVSDYGYNSNRLISSIMTRNSKDRQGYHYTYYPTDFSTTTIYKAMIDKNILSPIVKESLVTYNGVFFKNVITNYTADRTSGLILPSSQESGYGSSDLRTDLTYDRYDTKGNVLQTTTLTDLTTIYLWSYDSLYPVAEIKNATYSAVEAALSSVGLTSVAALASSLNPDREKLEKLRTVSFLSDAQISTFTYKPLVGIVTITSPSGITTYYDYDPFGRLKETYIYKDNIVSPANKQVVQSYDYLYQNQ